MASPAQILSNRANALQSTGPVTPEGKSRCSRNAITSGLFSKSDHINAGESEIYAEFCAAYETDIRPEGAIEHTLAAELIHAAWRLRRCSELEGAGDPADAPVYERLQNSIERARSSALRVFHRCLAELRRLQTERHMRAKLARPNGEVPDLGVAGCKEVQSFQKPVPSLMETAIEQYLAVPPLGFAKQTQSPAEPRRPAREERSHSFLTARSAPCTCGSGLKYKRCCGKDAPAVLHHAA